MRPRTTGKTRRSRPGGPPAPIPGDGEHQDHEHPESCPHPGAHRPRTPLSMGSPPLVFYHPAACAARGRIFPAPARGNPAPRDRRAISVPLAPVTGGLSRSLAETSRRRSTPCRGRIVQLPKLTVRVRFPSPAPMMKAQAGPAPPIPGRHRRSRNPARSVASRPHRIRPGATFGGAGRLYNPDFSSLLLPLRPLSYALKGHRHRARRVARSDVSHLIHHLPGRGRGHHA